MSGAGPDPAAFIQAHLPLTPVRGCPDILIHRATPASGVSRLCGRATPYWAYEWAGGLALARHIAARPETVAGLRVLDLGAGCGLVAIAAAKAGADAVLAAETDAHGRAALALNAAANDVEIAILTEDAARGQPPAVDLILAGDVFYDRAVARRMTRYLDRCAAAGIRILVGDPRRAFLPLERLRLIAEYPVSDFGLSAAAPARPGAVFAFETS